MRLHGDIEGGATQDFLIWKHIEYRLTQANDSEGVGHLGLMHCGAAVHVDILAGHKA